MGFANWPYGDFQDLNLDYILKNVRRAVDTANSAKEIAENLKKFVEDYFDNLDVQTEINNKIDSMVLDGSFEEVLLNFVPAIIDTWLAAHITNPGNPPLDSTLTLENAAARSKTVGEKFDSIEPYNSVNVLSDIWNTTDGSMENVTYSWNGKVCTVSSPGVSSGVSVKNLITPFSNIPDSIVPGKRYPVTYKTNNVNVVLSVVFYNSNNERTEYQKTGNGHISVPSDAETWTVRLFCASGVNPNAVVSDIGFLSAESNTTIVNELIFNGKDSRNNRAAAYTYFNGITDYDAENRLPVTNFPVNSYFYAGGYRFSEDFGLSDSLFYWAWCWCSMYNPAIRYYIIKESKSGKIKFGHTANSGESVVWSESFDNRINILSIGSSFGEDCCVYAPWLIEEMCPDVSVTFGILYYSGGSISKYNEWIDNNFSEIRYYKRTAGASAWSAETLTNVKAALADEDWDVVLVNQRAVDGGVWNSYSDMGAYLRKIAANSSKNIKIGFIMTQRALGGNFTYDDVLDCAKRVMANYPVSFVIPSGAAIEYARGTSLDSIGANGHLAYDDLGHLQEGLPVLIANYATAAAILEYTNAGFGKIYGSKINPSATWIANHNIPGQNGGSVGVTDSNKLTGQECAIRAMKVDFNT